MKYAKITCPEIESKDSKFPPRIIREKLFERKNPITYEYSKILDKEGYNVTVTINKDFGFTQRRLKNAFDCLIEAEVNVVIPPKNCICPNDIASVDGTVVMAFLADIIGKYTVEKRSGIIEASEVVIIDGENIITDSALFSLAKNSATLSVFTSRPQRFDDFSDIIYEQYGLRINTFSSHQNKLLRSADLVVNCNKSINRYDYFYKKNCCYIDLTQQTSRLESHINHRPDILFVDGAILDINNEIIDCAMLEAYLYITYNPFKRYTAQREGKIPPEAVENFIREMNIKIKTLTCLENDV